MKKSKLNRVQKAAVEAYGKPVLIFAGAGSGKTRVLTHKIAYLVDKGLVEPKNILALTFTNKASKEMKARVHKLVKVPDGLITMGTFHSVCAKILRNDIHNIGYNSDFSIFDIQDQISLLKIILDEMKIPKAEISPQGARHRISFLKNKIISPSAAIKKANLVIDKTYASIYKTYQGELAKNNSVDFDDLLLLPLKIFEENQEILSKYQNLWKYILVDEYQDTNMPQFKLVKYLSGDHQQVCVVGDDDQSIYGWRGALSKNIKSFTDQFTDVEIFKLEQNYRSTNKILKVANSLISHNKNRLGKELWTASERGETVKIFEAYNNDEESSFIVDKIKMLERDGYKKSEIAILYRNNFLSRRLEEELNGRGIPYIIYGGFRFFERSEIKDMIAYLRVIVNPDDDSAFERTINNPPRGIGQKTIDIIRKFAKADNRSLWKTIKSLQNQNNDEISSRVKTSLTNYISLIEIISNEINDLSLDEILVKIYKESKLKSYYSEQKGEEAISKQENIEELFITAENFIKNNYDSENIIDDFLDNAALEAGDYQSKLDNDPVQLMTIHSAKGLEFPVVFLTGLEEGIFPNENRKSGEDFLEEERRLCYVAITRAMKSLYITFANARYLHGSYNYLMPSRFISEIPDELLESVKSDNYQHVKSKNVIPMRKKDDHKHGFKIGQRVKHQKFGSGVVLSYEGEDDNLKLYINFEDYGSKWLVLTYAHLEFL